MCKAPRGGASPSAPRRQGSYTLAEIAKHATKGDCWLIIRGQVYDVSSWCVCSRLRRLNRAAGLAQSTSCF